MSPQTIMSAVEAVNGRVTDAGCVPPQPGCWWPTIARRAGDWRVFYRVEGARVTVYFITASFPWTISLAS